MIIHNATLITFDAENRILADGAVRFSGAQIDAVGANADLLAAYPDDERWDAHGLVLMPGQICAHTHFYGAFARGMYIPGPPAKDFPEILNSLWWKLDKALDLDGVRASAEVCLADAIRNGTTTLIDHHASQTALDGSLDVIAAAVTARPRPTPASARMCAFASGWRAGTTPTGGWLPPLACTPA